MSTTENGWHLGIDFGTSYTVAAISSAAGTTVLDVESNGQTRMPSSVFLTEDGEVLIGTAAQHQSAFAPERYEAAPKRCIADRQIFLGTQMVEVTTLIAAILRRVFAEACRQQGERLPRSVQLTHPAEWGQGRLDLLLEAAAKGGLPQVTLLPEPVAAAAWIAATTTRTGELIAVYDFGGGTFDAAVLRRTATGFEVAGPPAGRDPLGGEDIDRHIIEYISTIVEDQTPGDWSKLMDAPDVTWRRRSIALRMEVQRAKETLSEVNSCQLWIPGLERELQLTRAELEKLILPDLEACTEVLLTALRDAKVSAEQLQGVYLVGGSSRIPLAAETLWRKIGVTPSVQDNPKSVVALGAAGWSTIKIGPSSSSATSPSVSSERSVGTANDATPVLTLESRDPSGLCVIPPSLQLELPPELATWRERVSTFLVLDRVQGDPATIRIRDESSRGADVETVARRSAAFRAERSDDFADRGLRQVEIIGHRGLERSFSYSAGGRTLVMIERYVVAGDRVLVMALPEEFRELADRFTSARWPNSGPTLRAATVLLRPDGWRTTETIQILGRGNVPALQADRTELPAEPVEAWRWHRLEALLKNSPEAGLAGRVAGRIMGALPGEIITVRWRGSKSVMITKLGSAASGGHGFMMTVNLPLAEQGDFRKLAALVSLVPGVLA
jgi:molecular chaperone DnaK